MAGEGADVQNCTSYSCRRSVDPASLTGSRVVGQASPIVLDLGLARTGRTGRTGRDLRDVAHPKHPLGLVGYGLSNTSGCTVLSRDASSERSS